MQPTPQEPVEPAEPAGGVPRSLTYVPIVSGPARGMLARVPEDSDQKPVPEVTVDRVRYELQRGPQGWEYLAL